METNNPIELRVYRGADGVFTLYEDEGDKKDTQVKTCVSIQL